MGGVTPNHEQRIKTLPGSFAVGGLTSSNIPSNVAPLYLPPLTSMAYTFFTALVFLL